jgi:hypothetical protein
MKAHRTRTAALLLAVALALPIAPLTASPRGKRDRDVTDPVVRIIKNIRKFFGITALDDLPSPPKP